MKKSLIFFLSFGLVLGLACLTPAQADEHMGYSPHHLHHNDVMGSDHELVFESGDLRLSISAEIRSRYEWSDNLFDFEDDSDDDFGFVPTRTRIGFQIDLPRDVHGYIELQHTGHFGDAFPVQRAHPPVAAPLDGYGLEFFTFGSAAPFSGPDIFGSTSGREFGLYQGYIDVLNVGGSNFSLRFGRQELGYGSEMLIGDLDFYGGIVFDGIKGTLEFDEGVLWGFWTKVSEFRSHSGGLASDEDADFWGIVFEWDEVGAGIALDAAILHLRSGFDGSDTPPGYTPLTQWTIDVRFHRDVETGLHWSAELAYQFGEIIIGDASAPLGFDDGDDTDVDAWAFEGVLGWTWDVHTNPDLHGGYIQYSGTDWSDPGFTAESDFETFTAPFQDYHQRLGLADVFGADSTPAAGLEAWTIGYSGHHENQSWGLDFWWLWWAEALKDVEVSSSGSTKDIDELGTELDLWYGYQFSQHLSLNAGLSFIFVDEGFDIDPFSWSTVGVDADDAMRFYVNLRLRLN